MKIQGIGTHIKVKDFAKSVRFYQALGFSKVFSYGPNEKVKEDYNGMVFQHGGCKLEIADGHRAVKSEVFEREMNDSKVSLMIYIDDIRVILRCCEIENISLAVEPRHYYWGTSEVVVKDPDGVVLVFIAPYDEKVALEIGANETWGKSGI